MREEEQEEGWGRKEEMKKGGEGREGGRGRREGRGGGERGRGGGEREEEGEGGGGRGRENELYFHWLSSNPLFNYFPLLVK